MHELTIANRIVDRALATADEADAETLTAVTVEVGVATHLVPRQLRFCIEAVADDTAVADADVTIEHVAARGTCECGWDGSPPTLDDVAGSVPASRCPECDGPVEFTAGRECRLASIEIP